MSSGCSSEDIAHSQNSNGKERDGTGSDVENKSQSSLTDSLESENVHTNGGNSKIPTWRPTRLPRFQRSHTFNTRSPVSRQTRVSAHSHSRQSDKLPSPLTGGFTCLESGECGSTHSLCRWNSDSKAQVRENTTSKRRFELQHSTHDLEAETTDYLTPSQRKDQLIKDLRAQVRDLKQARDERDMEEEQIKFEMREEAVAEAEKQTEEMENLRKELEDVKCKYEDLTKSYEESVKSVTNLEETIRELRAGMEAKEKEQERLYLQMYRKGRQVAQIEREEELEDMVSKGIRSPSFTIRELVRKLAVTETELAKWQSLRLKEAYNEGGKPENQSEATLRFLKDSFLHYLTDVKDSDDHLRAMIRIFHYDDDQKKKIAKVLLEGRHLKK